MATLFDQNMAEYGITQAQFRVLLEIYNRGGHAGVAPSVLADHLLIERGTVTVLTSRMVNQGLLTRKAGENRRTFQLCLTDVGRSKLEAVLPSAISLADEVLEGVTQEEMRRVLEQLAKLEVHLRTNNSRASTP